MIDRNRGRPAPFIASLAVFCALGACASAGIVGDTSDAPDPESVLRQGVDALGSGHFREAHEDLSWVYTHYPEQDVGRRALLVIAAAEMDPRNPDQRLTVGARLLERFFAPDSIAGWQEPVAESMYLLALDLGARDTAAGATTDSAGAADSAAGASGMDAAGATPRLPRASLAHRLRNAEILRDSLAERNAAMAAHMKELEGQLTDAKKELERIKKTLKG